MPKTILAVDYFEANLDLYRGAIPNSYNLLTSNNSREALGVLSNQTVDLLITDLSVGEIPGDQLMVEAYRRNPYIKIILATKAFGDSLDFVLKSLEKEGVKAKHLPKPIKAERLLELVETLIGK